MGSQNARSARSREGLRPSHVPTPLAEVGRRGEAAPPGCLDPLAMLALAAKPRVRVVMGAPDQGERRARCTSIRVR